MTARCGWLRRRWHARQRRLDRELMFPALEQIARRYPEGERETRISAAKAAFMREAGQEHWRCLCALEEGAP